MGPRREPGYHIMLDELLKRRLLLILGKGGVGRTSVSAALGLAMARAGARVCVVEYDSRAPMAALFGREPSYEPIEVEPGMSLIALDGPRTLAEYLRVTLPSPAMLRTIISSRLYNYFVLAAPGLRELIMIGKLYHEIERRPAGQPPWDLVIFDAPASGQALDLLRMPLTAEETFGASIVGHEARNVAAFLRDRKRSAVLQVATGEALAMSETLEFHAALSGIGMEPAAVVFNRRVPLPFGRAEIARLTRLLAAGNGNKLPPFIRRANRLLMESRRNDEAVRALKDGCGPLIELADHPEAHGRPLVKLIAAEIAQLRSGVEPRAAGQALS
ncbi:MAG TPA: ArsA-related P-loop ATPase [Candidatus Binataceae bacterium]|nr:ArsA-related P-loop ATPase [Candidatus Binataceae bacterium]